jgi:hypothetical protein
VMCLGLPRGHGSSGRLKDTRSHDEPLSSFHPLIANYLRWSKGSPQLFSQMQPKPSRSRSCSTKRRMPVGGYRMRAWQSRRMDVEKPDRRGFILTPPAIHEASRRRIPKPQGSEGGQPIPPPHPLSLQKGMSCGLCPSGSC